jgi:hypothetical protein
MDAMGHRGGSIAPTGLKLSYAYKKLHFWETKTPHKSFNPKHKFLWIPL